MDSVPKRRIWDRTLTVASIAFVAAIAGAAVGGFATYLANRTLQSEQSRASAKGIARVLESQLADSEPRLQLALNERRVIVPEAISPVRLDLQDEELLASNLDSEAWTKVAETISGLSLEREAMDPSSGDEAALKARAGLHVTLDGPLLSLERSLLVELEESVTALQSLSGA
jgi:hypothetical protein